MKELNDAMHITRPMSVERTDRCVHILGVCLERYKKHGVEEFERRELMQWCGWTDFERFESDLSDARQMALDHDMNLSNCSNEGQIHLMTFAPVTVTSRTGKSLDTGARRLETMIRNHGRQSKWAMAHGATGWDLAKAQHYSNAADAYAMYLSGLHQMEQEKAAEIAVKTEKLARKDAEIARLKAELARHQVSALGS